MATWSGASRACTCPSPATAARTWAARRASRRSWPSSSQALGAGFSLERFFDELNGVGMLPVPLIRYELTGKDDELRRLE